MAKRPPAPKQPKSKPKAPTGDMFARMLAKHVATAHGVGSATTLDMSDEIASPRGFIGVNNIALERALGIPGIPLGRITEISGWPGAGKSTMLDQILSQCQAEGGIGVLADTERGRNRSYMSTLGVQPASLVWIGGQTVEAMFEEVETLARVSSSFNAIAWHEAMQRAGIKVPALGFYKYVVFDPTAAKNTKPVASYTLMQWSRGHAAALLDWQRDQGMKPSGVRDAKTRETLRPCVIQTDDKALRKEALSDWDKGIKNPYVQAADRPILIGWDSVAGTATEAELEGSARDVHPATAAKVIRRNLRRLIQLIDDEAIGVVLVNQRYEKLNIGGRPQWGKQSETYGGGGIKYHTTLRVEVDKRGDIYGPGKSRAQGHPPCGQEVVIKVPKNKLADPFRTERYGLMFGKGANDAWAIHEDLKERGIIRSSGGWSRFVSETILEGDKSFRGWMELDEMMQADPELAADLKSIYMEGV
jgi:RecA/RadA recombinase